MYLGPIHIVELLVAYHAIVMGGWTMVQRAHLALGAMAWVFGFHMLANLGSGTGLLPPALDVTSAFGLLYGPLLYLQVRSLCRSDGAPRTPDLVHVLPALLVAVLRPADPLPQLLGLPLLVGYLVRVARLLGEHRRLVAELRADDGAVDLAWVRGAFVAFVVLAAVDLARSAAEPALGPAASDAVLAAVLLGVLALLTFMTLRGFRHSALEGAVAPERAAAVQGATTPGSKAEAGWFELVDRVIRAESLWREPGLSLASVGERTGLNVRDVSRAINLGAGCSFSRYVNGLRVDAFDALAGDPAHRDRPVLELAFEVGFNAKSTFNRTYRELRGTTPSRNVDRGAARGPES